MNKINNDKYVYCDKYFSLQNYIQSWNSDNSEWVTWLTKAYHVVISSLYIYTCVIGIQH
jgi:hypothetical protein